MSQGSGRDTRVILLCKKLLTDGHCHQRTEIDGISIGEPLITLGYFDAAYIYGLGEQGDVKELERHSNALASALDGKVYYHPLYIIRYGEPQNAFWEANANFVMITMVHDLARNHKSSEDVKNSVRRLEELLERELNKAGAAVPAHVIYRTMDLSDLVILWKTDAIENVMSALFLLHKTNCVGHFHTIFGAPHELVRHPDRYKGSERLPLVTVHATAKNFNSVCSILDAAEECLNAYESIVFPRYWLTGHEDVAIPLKDLPMRVLLRLLDFWLNNEQSLAKAVFDVTTQIGVNFPPSDEPAQNGGNTGLTDSCKKIQERSLAEAVFDGTPQIGVDFPPPGEPAQNGGNTGLTDSCEKIQERFQNINWDEKRYTWVKPVRELLNSLVSMSGNCVLDGFCYLILDGVSDFCDKLTDFCTDGRAALDRLDRDEENIQRSVRGWSLLVDQVVRTDGQFVQNPGYGPLVFNMPASLLEFYLAFTNRCMDYMQYEGGVYKHHILLVPQLCRRMKTRKVFADPPPCERLLYVDVPLHDLYNPFTVLCQLCHEISHFCGGSARSRDSRYQVFLGICAYLAAYVMELGSDDVVREIARMLDREIPEEKRHYMEDLCPAAETILCQQMGVDPIYRDRLQRMYVEGRDPYIGLQEIQANSRYWASFTRKLDFEGFIRMVNFGAQLCVECYADVSMIWTLTLTAREYVSLFDQEMRYVRNSQYSQRDLANLLQRVGAVAMTLYDGAELEKLLDDEENVNDPLSLRAGLVKYCAAVRENRLEDLFDDPQDFLPVHVCNLLMDYLRICLGKMKARQDDENLREIRDLFDEAARKGNICSDRFYETITYYRNMILDRLPKKDPEQKE